MFVTEKSVTLEINDITIEMDFRYCDNQPKNYCSGFHNVEQVKQVKAQCPKKTLIVR
jgi:hypothetical protein